MAARAGKQCGCAVRWKRLFFTTLVAMWTCRSMLAKAVPCLQKLARVSAAKGRPLVTSFAEVSRGEGSMRGRVRDCVG